MTHSKNLKNDACTWKTSFSRLPFDSFQFLSKFFSLKLRVWLICECGLYASFNIIYLNWSFFGDFLIMINVHLVEVQPKLLGTIFAFICVFLPLFKCFLCPVVESAVHKPLCITQDKSVKVYLAQNMFNQKRRVFQPLYDLYGLIYTWSSRSVA